MSDLAPDGPLVVQYWHSEERPQPIAELLASFPRHNPGLRQLVFGRSSAEAFIAEHYSQRHLDAFRACAHPAGQADYLRYCAGHVFGGLCIEADVRCGGDLRPLLGRLERGFVFGETKRHPEWVERIFAWPYAVGRYRVVMNGAFAFVRPGDPLLGLAIEVATANVENRVSDGPAGAWLTTGPGVFTSIYLLHRLGSMDAFVRYAEGTVLEPAVPLFCEVVGDRSRADLAFEGIEIAAVEEFDHALLEHVGIPRSDGGGNHWSRLEDSIFR